MPSLFNLFESNTLLLKKETVSIYKNIKKHFIIKIKAKKLSYVLNEF